MDWLNLHIPTALRSPEYIGSSPAERGTWLSVLAYACGIECGGRLVGAAGWKDRQWQQACGVTLREINAASRLLHMEGADVLVNGYPVAIEEKVRKNRGNAMAGAMARWGNKGAMSDAESMPCGMPCGNAKGEGEGKERKGEPAPSPSPGQRMPDGMPADYTATAATGPLASPPGERKLDIPTAVHRFRAANASAIRAAAKKRNLLGIVRGFGADSTHQDWPSATDGMVLGLVVAIFGWSLERGFAIRAPSGFRKSTERWSELPIEDRRDFARLQCGLYGISVPA